MSRGGTAAADWCERLAGAGLIDPAALLDESPIAEMLLGTWQPLIKPGLGGRERWRWQLDDGASLYLKRYLRTSLREQLDRIRRQTIRHSRAWWEFRQSAELARQQVPAVRAIAMAEEMRGVLECRSIVLFEPAAGEALDRIWPRFCRAQAPITQGPARHDVVRRLARFVSAFHQTGYCHRDLYLCHIFAELDPAAASPPRFALIDLARTHRPFFFRMRWLLKDLSQLDVSARQVGATRSDRMRFLLTYLGLETRAARTRWYTRRIVRKSSRILRRIKRQAAAAPEPPAAALPVDASSRPQSAAKAPVS